MRFFSKWRSKPEQKPIRKQETDGAGTEKGSIREPTQKSSAVGEVEEMKQALQELEEAKGDWSRSR